MAINEECRLHGRAHIHDGLCTEPNRLYISYTFLLNPEAIFELAIFNLDYLRQERNSTRKAEGSEIC
jgi:hypothetical protein